ncbi:hypothetical protein YPPY94_1801, partial [Yersinia pestis PY-94]
CLFLSAAGTLSLTSASRAIALTGFYFIPDVTVYLKWLYV